MSEISLHQDTDARREALDPRVSFIVQAPAGSGKTELLTQRYLNLLSTVNAPEEIVALTFTRKAAQEMRMRILDALQDAAHDDIPAEPHKARTREIAQRARRHSETRNWRLLENPARLRIQTIDSLCSFLTAQMPLLSQLGARPRVREDASELYREASRRTLDRLNGAGALSLSLGELLLHLDNDFGTTERLLVSMLARRDQWLRQLGVTERPEAMRQSLEEALRGVIEEKLSQLDEAIPRAEREELVRLAQFAGRNLRGAGIDSPIAVFGDFQKFPEPEIEDLPYWQAIGCLLLTQACDKWRSRFTMNEGFPKGFTAEKKAVTRLRNVFCDDDELFERMVEVMRLPKAGYSGEEWRILEAVIEVLRRAAIDLQLTFQEHGEVDFTETALRAIQALGTEDRPTDIALAMDYRIQHILVDEFQDTSYMQFELLARLTAGWEQGDGRTLFVVGDPMQSIYRFREAEVGLFIKAREYGIGTTRLAPLSLTTNFRSSPEVIRWVNETFREVFPEEENIGQGAVTYSPSSPSAEASPGGAVSFIPVIGKDGQEEAGTVAEIVRRHLGEGSVAILVRARTHVEQIAEQLRRGEVPYRAVEIERLADRPVVQDLMALTRALLHPADRIAWLAVLRAPWCGLTLNDLYQLTSVRNDAVGDRPGGSTTFDRTRGATVWTGLNDPAALKRLTVDGRRRVVRMQEVLHESLLQRYRKSFRRWIEGVWVALGGPAALEAPRDMDDARAYLDLLEKLDTRSGPQRLTDIRAEVEKLRASPGAEGTHVAQILTIHKAKGLEFDTVIIPGLARKTRQEADPMLRWMERPRADVDEPDLLLGALSSRRSAGDGPTVYSFVKSLEKERDDFEQVRMLYVGATRSKRRLYFTAELEAQEDGTWKSPASNTFLGCLWDVLENTATHNLPPDRRTLMSHESGPVIAGRERNLSIRRLRGNWMLPAAPPAVRWAPPYEDVVDEVEFEGGLMWRPDVDRHVGTVVHRLLVQIAEDGVDRWDEGRLRSKVSSIISALRQLGTYGKDLRGGVQRIYNALYRSITDPRGKWILDIDHGHARNEFPVTGSIRDKLVNVIIDRTFVDVYGTRWIIDYKTSEPAEPEAGDIRGFLNREQERYAGQLDRYAYLMRRLEKHPIRLGLYFPLVSGWREWDYEG